MLRWHCMLTCVEGDAMYVRELELPFAPFVGLTMAGIFFKNPDRDDKPFTISDVTWLHRRQSFWVEFDRQLSWADLKDGLDDAWKPE